MAKTGQKARFGPFLGGQSGVARFFRPFGPKIPPHCWIFGKNLRFLPNSSPLLDFRPKMGHFWPVLGNFGPKRPKMAVLGHFVQGRPGSSRGRLLNRRPRLGVTQLRPFGRSCGLTRRMLSRRPSAG